MCGNLDIQHQVQISENERTLGQRGNEHTQ